MTCNLQRADRRPQLTSRARHAIECKVTVTYYSSHPHSRPELTKAALAAEAVAATNWSSCRGASSRLSKRKQYPNFESLRLLRERTTSLVWLVGNTVFRSRHFAHIRPIMTNYTCFSLKRNSDIIEMCVSDGPLLLALHACTKRGSLSKLSVRQRDLGLGYICRGWKGKIKTWAAFSSLKLCGMLSDCRCDDGWAHVLCAE